MIPSESLAPPSNGALDTVQEIVGTLVERHQKDEVVTTVRQIPARLAKFRLMRGWVTSALSEAYHAKGIQQLYSHQSATAELVHDGKNVVVVTPTASGKTLCYNLPVVNAVLENSDTRYLSVWLRLRRHQQMARLPSPIARLPSAHSRTR